MYVQVRLYASHDFDLIALSALRYMKLDDVIHAAVCAYVRNEPMSAIQIPQISFNSPIRDVRLCITFDERTEQDVIGWIEHIQGGLRNSAMKVITRMYLSNEYLYSLYAPSLAGAAERSVQANANRVVQNQIPKPVANNDSTSDEYTIEKIPGSYKPKKTKAGAATENKEAVKPTTPVYPEQNTEPVVEENNTDSSVSIPEEKQDDTAHNSIFDMISNMVDEF